VILRINDLAREREPYFLVRTRHLTLLPASSERLTIAYDGTRRQL
jgi:hypothetical protein